MSAANSDPTIGRPTKDDSGSIQAPFPLYLEGEVVKGFGRGSKELGIPTANYSQDYVDGQSLKELKSGIYYGYSYIVPTSEESTNFEGQIFPMVMSLGWNPFYKNEKRSAEVYIINQFKSDFYGKEMKTLILGFIRDERSYDSLDALKKDIWFDVEFAKNSLSQAYLLPENFQKYFTK